MNEENKGTKKNKETKKKLRRSAGVQAKLMTPLILMLIIALFISVMFNYSIRNYSVPLFRAH